MPHVDEEQARQSLRMIAIRRMLRQPHLESTPGSDVLIQAATEALVAGLDSPALRELAGLGKSEEPEAPALFESALDELALRPALPADEQAARWTLVEWWASLVASGELAPAQGGHLIWHDGWNELGHPARLQPIVGWTSEYDDWTPDWEEPRAVYEQRIVDACRDLLRSQQAAAELRDLPSRP